MNESSSKQQAASSKQQAASSKQQAASSSSALQVQLQSRSCEGRPELKPNGGIHFVAGLGPLWHPYATAVPQKKKQSSAMMMRR
jgi:hypothetical protein